MADAQTEPDAHSRFADRTWLWLALILLIATGVRVWFIDRPFHRDPEGCSAFYGQLARNYIRRPIAQTHGVPVQNMGRHNPPVFYAHHPPVVPVSIAAVYWLGGFRADSDRLPPDWQTRLPTVLFTLGCVVTIYLMLRNRGAPRAGVIAAGIFAFAPITALYGGFADVISPELLLFILLTVAAYEQFWQTPNWRTLTITSIAFAPAIFTDWPAMFLPVVLGVHFVVTRPPRRWPWVIGFGLVCGLWFFLAYAQIWMVEHDWLWIRETLTKRSISGMTDQKTPFTFAAWLRVAVDRAAHLHTWPVLLLAAAWVLAQSFDVFRSRATRIVLILLAWAALHILVGRQGVYQHEWWWWPLTPGVAMASALVVDWIYNRLTLDAGRQLACVFATTLVICIASLAVLSTRRTYNELHRHLWIIPGDERSHSIVDMGTVIRESAPPDTAVILVENDLTLGLWYYADRPIMQNVWTIPDLLDRISNPQTADLPFGWTEEWRTPPARAIVPKVYLTYCPPLIEYLRSHYPTLPLSAKSEPKFIVFDLTRPTNDK